MSTSDILESLIEKDNGYLITSKAVESGVSKPSVSKYVREHDMEKVAHGIYILDEVWPDELFVLQQRNKNIIYSGETALYLHGLIDREYSHICFTVPTGYNATHIKKKNKEVRYANPEILDMGICEIPSSSGNLVKVYDKERCICDMLKSDDFDLELQNSILHDYFNSSDKEIDKLLEYSKIFNIYEKVRTLVDYAVR